MEETTRQIVHTGRGDRGKGLLLGAKGVCFWSLWKVGIVLRSNIFSKTKINDNGFFFYKFPKKTDLDYVTFFKLIAEIEWLFFWYFFIESNPIFMWSFTLIFKTLISILVEIPESTIICEQFVFSIGINLYTFYTLGLNCMFWLRRQLKKCLLQFLFTLSTNEHIILKVN